MLQNAITQKLYALPAAYWETSPQKIAAVTPANALHVAQKYLNLSKLQIIAAGAAKQISNVLKGFGSIELYGTEGNPLHAAVNDALSTGKKEK